MQHNKHMLFAGGLGKKTRWHNQSLGASAVYFEFAIFCCHSTKSQLKFCACVGVFIRVIRVIRVIKVAHAHTRARAHTHTHTHRHTHKHNTHNTLQQQQQQQQHHHHAPLPILATYIGVSATNVYMYFWAAVTHS